MVLEPTLAHQCSLQLHFVMALALVPQDLVVTLVVLKFHYLEATPAILDSGWCPQPTPYLRTFAASVLLSTVTSSANPSSSATMIGPSSVVAD